VFNYHDHRPNLTIALVTKLNVDPSEAINHPTTTSPRGWHSRGYLPHFDAGELPQAITFRLVDSIPATLIHQWREELKLTAGVQGDAADQELLRIETFLNRGTGPTWLADPTIAALVENALLYFDGSRYRLHAWVIMPNHVHVVITPLTDVSIPGIESSWKSFTANRANTLLGRHGPFWQKDYFDRFIRDERHFAAAIHYAEENPVVAGLCASADQWKFSSARRQWAPG
jgi:REP element-mobilizing transposase RayT